MQETLKKFAGNKIAVGTLVAAFVIVLAMIYVKAQAYSYSPSPLSYYSGSIGTYWPAFGKEECLARQDFIVQILPGGCSPAVIRSDLLEEQDVPVFCQLIGIKINPLIEVPEITSISFKGQQLPKDIAGIGFHPARAALQTYGTQLLGSPVLNNFGYLVVIIRRQPIEGNMSKWIEANLTALIQYNAEKALGIGKAGFLLPVLSDDEWQQYYKQYSFWNGKAYIRALEIGKDPAGEYMRVAIYLDANKQITSLMLRPGQPSNEIYLPGYYCSAALKINLNSVNYPEIKAKIRIGDDEFWLAKGQRFLEENCWVSNIEQNIIGGGKVTINCKDSTPATLEIDPPRARLLVKDSATKKEVASDDFAVRDELVSGKGIYLGYVGNTEKALSTQLKQLNQDFVVIVKPEAATEDYFNNLNIVVNSILKGRKYSFFNVFKTLLKGSVKFGEDVKCLSGCDASLEKGLHDYLGKDALFQIVSTSGTGQGTAFQGYHFTFDKTVGSVEKRYESEDFGKLLEKYFADAAENYKKVAEHYGDEKKEQQEGAKPTYYGADALYEAAKLAAELKKFKTQEDLLNRIVKDYPDSGVAENAKQELELMRIHDRSKASAFVYTAGGSYYTILEDIKEVGRDDKSVDLTVDSATETYSENEVVKGTLAVAGITEEYVDFSYQNKEGDLRTLKIKEKDSVKTLFVKDIETDKEISVSLRVSKINLKKEASVTLEPMIARAQTQTNFTFKMGIEKRAIKLSPEKTQELINELNDSIAKWETIVNNLGNLVKTWKGTCFAGSAYLVVKNFFSNMGGGSMARTEAMNHWKTICKGEIAEAKKQGVEMSFHKCYTNHADEIDASVGKIKEIYADVNNDVGSIKNMPNVLETQKGTFGIFDEKSTNQDACLKASQEYFNKYQNTVFKSGEKGKDDIKASEFLSEDKITLLRENNRIYCDDVKDILFSFKLQQECTNGDFKSKKEYKQFCEQINSRLYSDMKEWKTISSELQKTKTAQELLDNEGIHARIISWGGGFDNPLPIKKEDLIPKKDYIKLDEKGIKISEKQEAAMITSAFGEYILIFEPSGSDYNIKKVYSIETENKKIISAKEEERGKKLVDLKISFARLTEPGQYSNPYKNPDVKYWESGPYKGLPAVLPLGEYASKGWYVATQPANLGTQATKAFAESGMPVSYWISNVNGNGLEEWETAGHGDDKPYYMFSMQTGMPLEFEFSGLDKQEAAKMVSLARQYLLDASKQYTGKGMVTVGGKSFFRGKPAVAIPQYECEDFMSPKECNIMFNLCDPVLCPSSRCDFGGKYPVADVVQTGVIGSIALCLPNIREGIAVPICLTGIHAGLDNFVMIQKAVRDCLQENLKTGRNVGICDQIKSIYLCEFFWKQAAPLAKVGISSLLESLSGKSNNGGGEYLFVQDSWQKAQDSVNYFTNYYGVNAFKAFQARSTEAAGTEVCKAWASVRYPTTAGMFGKLLAPESPTQFYATFSEDVLTEATLPPTSHYKVYFRIYAGNDQGVYYNVYLKGQPQTEYYAQMQQIAVPNAVGYIPQGEQVDRATDFTAPSGYKELCVRINAQEECGFGQVTTSFFMNELKDTYLKEQATQPITKESDCIEGKPSITPVALNLNLQAGVSEATQPAIYERGIIRICATDNPSMTTQPDRWKQVGYCGDKKTICWLDTISLNNSFKDKGLLGETLDKAKEMAKELEEGKMLGEEESDKALQGAGENKENLVGKEEVGKAKTEGELDKLLSKEKLQFADADTVEADIDDAIKSTVSQYEEVITKSALNAKKAEARFEFAGIYGKITRLIYENKVRKSEGEEEAAVGAEINLDKSNEITEVFYERDEKTILFDGKKYYVSVDLSDLSGKTRISISLDSKLIFPQVNQRHIYNLDGKGGNDVEVTWDGFSKTPSIRVTLKFERISKIKEKKCSDCNKLFSSCSMDECHDMGDCYVNYKTGVISSKYDCLDCNANLPYKPLCSDFNTPEECEGNKCDVIGCAWVNGECQIKVETEEKKLAQIKTTAEQCTKCGEGLLNRCDREECHNLGNCYLEFASLITYQCINCNDKTKCSAFDDYNECKFNKCNLDCGWTSSGCVQSSSSADEKKNLNEASEDTAETPDNVICMDIDAEENPGTITGSAVSNNEVCIIIGKGYSASDILQSKSESTFQSRQTLYALVDKYAKQYNVNFNLVRAFIEVESSWDTKEQSSTGAYGLMQIKDTVINDFKEGGACAKSIGILSINKYNTEQNIQGGVAYLACNMKRFSNLGLAIAAYKEGPTYVSKYCNTDVSSCKNPLFKQNGDTAKAYVKKIGKAYYYTASLGSQANAAAPAVKKPANKKVVIDAGHGGTDPGAVNSGGIKEKDINLQIVKELRSILESKGYTLKMTRDADISTSLASRVKTANDFGADIFVSIHMNSASLDVDGKYCSANGTETFYYRTSTKGKEFAQTIQENVVSAIGNANRGIKKDTESAEGSLYVLKNTNMPAVLIELGFICNKEEIQILSNSLEQEQIAAAISQAVSTYLS